MDEKVDAPKNFEEIDYLISIYNQSYGLATAPTEHIKKVIWYKTHNNHDILAKRLHLFSVINRRLNCCRANQISDGMEKVL